MNSLYFVVVVNQSPQDAERVMDSYLYAHSTVFEMRNDDRYTFVVVKTDADTEDRARYLADYQQGRLASGLYPSTDAVATPEGAWDVLKDRMGYQPV